MARRSKANSSASQIQISFDDVIKSAEVLSREEVTAKSQQSETSQEYSPVSQTAGYMQRIVQLEDSWETTIQKAREALLEVDARQLYFDFFTDLKRQIEQNSPNAARLADLLESVAIRGFGINRKHLYVDRPAKGGTRWRVQMDSALVRAHLDSHIVGEHFLNLISADETTWQSHVPIIGASDVSQHRSAIPVPARYFKRSVPFVLNNAAGTLFAGIRGGKPKYENVFNPKPDETLLRWMLIDPSYQDELEPQDYERCVASAMDVGQYKFDLEYLLKADKRSPDVIFRDGSLFPQDAYLDNYLIQNKRGEFTREAIHELLTCLLLAREMGVIYCGVSKNVQLKVYSAVVDWYVEKYIDPNWQVGNYTLNDGQAMSLLLASPAFVGDNLSQVIATCLIRRSFTTRANLNVKANPPDLDSYFQFYQQQHSDIDISRFRRLCEIAHVYMFFLGHSKSPQQQLPRYEFFYADAFGPIWSVAQKILSALQLCGIQPDRDHSFMAKEPIIYLIPCVTQQAHILSKDVGSQIDSTTGQWIMARYQSLLTKNG